MGTCMRCGILGCGVLWLVGLCGCSSSESAGRGEGTNGGDGGESSGERGTADDDSTDVDNGGTDGSEACTVGDETCACYPNETCNGSLTCFSGLCVDARGGGGGAGGAQGDAGGAQGGAGNSSDLVGPSGAGGSASSGAGGAGSMSGGGGKVDSGGSGAVSTAGGAGTAGGSSTGGADTNASGGDDGYAVGARGYVTSGTWRGYAWVTADGIAGSGTTVAPTSFDLVEAGGQLCVSGIVGFDPESGAAGSLLLGINLAQPEGDTMGPRNTWVPTSGAIEYEVQNSAGSPLMMFIMGPFGFPEEAWCAVLEESSGSVGLTHFQDSCWEDRGRRYSEDGYPPLAAIALMVPGAVETTVPFDFCIVSIGMND